MLRGSNGDPIIVPARISAHLSLHSASAPFQSAAGEGGSSCSGGSMKAARTLALYGGVLSCLHDTLAHSDVDDIPEVGIGAVHPVCDSLSSLSSLSSHCNSSDEQVQQELINGLESNEQVTRKYSPALNMAGYGNGSIWLYSESRPCPWADSWRWTSPRRCVLHRLETSWVLCIRRKTCGMLLAFCEHARMQPWKDSYEAQLFRTGGPPNYAISRGCSRTPMLLGLHELQL